MRRKTFLTLLCLGLLALAACAPGGTDKNFTLADRDLLIDVRTPEEFNRGHLPGAINIPYTEIRQNIGRLTRDRQARIVLYCRSGRRSGIAQKTLVDMGYTSVINAGSYDELKKLRFRKANP